MTEEGVQTDSKVKVINDIQAVDLIKVDSVTPSHEQIRSFLGNFFFTFSISSRIVLQKPNPCSISYQYKHKIVFRGRENLQESQLTC